MHMHMYTCTCTCLSSLNTQSCTQREYAPLLGQDRNRFELVEQHP